MAGVNSISFYICQIWCVLCVWYGRTEEDGGVHRQVSTYADTPCSHHAAERDLVRGCPGGYGEHAGDKESEIKAPPRMSNEPGESKLITVCDGTYRRPHMSDAIPQNVQPTSCPRLWASFMKGLWKWNSFETAERINPVIIWNIYLGELQYTTGKIDVRTGYRLSLG